VEGEITEFGFHLWDLLDNKTELTCEFTYEIRYARLGLVFRGVDDALRVCETAMTPKAKTRLAVKAMHESRAKGSLCKIPDAAMREDVQAATSKNASLSSYLFLQSSPEPTSKAADGTPLHRLSLFVRGKPTALHGHCEYLSVRAFHARGRIVEISIRSTANPGADWKSSSK